MPHDAAELVINDALPETVPSKEEAVSVKTSTRTASNARRISPRLLAIIFATVAIIVLGTALGAGIGISRRKNSSSNISSNVNPFSNSVTVVASTATLTTSIQRSKLSSHDYTIIFVHAKFFLLLQCDRFSYTIIDR